MTTLHANSDKITIISFSQVNADKSAGDFKHSALGRIQNRSICEAHHWNVQVRTNPSESRESMNVGPSPNNIAMENVDHLADWRKASCNLYTR